MKLTKEYVANSVAAVAETTDIGKGVVASKDVAVTPATDPETKVYESQATRDAYIDNAAFEKVHYWAIKNEKGEDLTAPVKIDDFITNNTKTGYDLCTNYAKKANGEIYPVLAARLRETQEVVYAEVVLANVDTAAALTDLTADKIVATAYNLNAGEEYINW